MLGNRLLQTIVQAAYVCCAVGAACIVEHAAEPDSAHMPSIWKLPEVKALLGFRPKSTVKFINLDQCCCGAPSRKPTTLLAINVLGLPDLIRALPGQGKCV